jgi:hypothetical protein
LTHRIGLLILAISRILIHPYLLFMVNRAPQLGTHRLHPSPSYQVTEAPYPTDKEDAS